MAALSDDAASGRPLKNNAKPGHRASLGPPRRPPLPTRPQGCQARWTARLSPTAPAPPPPNPPPKKRTAKNVTLAWSSDSTTSDCRVGSRSGGGASRAHTSPNTLTDTAAATPPWRTWSATDGHRTSPPPPAASGTAATVAASCGRPSSTHSTAPVRAAASTATAATAAVARTAARRPAHVRRGSYSSRTVGSKVPARTTADRTLRMPAAWRSTAKTSSLRNGWSLGGVPAASVTPSAASVKAPPGPPPPVPPPLVPPPPPSPPPPAASAAASSRPPTGSTNRVPTSSAR